MNKLLRYLFAFLCFIAGTLASMYIVAALVYVAWYGLGLRGWEMLAWIVLTTPIGIAPMVLGEFTLLRQARRSSDSF